MDALTVLKTRRSIRKYQPHKPISKEHLEELLKAAMNAPSAHNKQPWHFILINDRKKLDAITSFSKNAQMCLQAPLAILICADKHIERNMDHCLEACSAATQNILLSAHAQRLGSVWTGVRPEKERMKGFKKLFNLPSNIEPFSLIVLGYPAETPKERNNYDETKIHYNNWDPKND